MNHKILICSDLSEGTTDAVCLWLNYLNKDFVRISSNNIITINDIIIKNKDVDITFSIDNTPYKLSDFSSYWYRRSYLNFAEFQPIYFEYNNVDLSEKVNAFMKDEYSKILKFFEYELNKIATLNKYKDNYLNKLQVLSIAQEIGISIPETYISEEFKGLNFRETSYITKAISDFAIFDDNRVFYSMTQRVSESEVKNSFYSLVQKEVDKKFEIRSFFFNKSFYSSAIFSQENEKTELDFRNYDYENPNRVVPYKLPSTVENKLLELANRISLKSGSFDLAYTKQGEYVLFEVNPVGQFEQVSIPCNYNLFKEVALIL